MYLTGYIERMGTGTQDMIKRCVEAGLPEPEFTESGDFRIIIRRTLAATGQVAVQATGQVAVQATGEVGGEVTRLLLVVDGQHSRAALQERLGLRGRSNFLRLYLEPALEAGLLEMTRPETPNSPSQEYRLTAKGQAVVESRRRA